MEVKLSQRTSRELASARDYGYKNRVEFIEDAVWHRILELKSSVKLTLSQSRDFARSRDELAKNEYVTLNELKHELGAPRSKAR